MDQKTPTNRATKVRNLLHAGDRVFKQAINPGLEKEAGVTRSPKQGISGHSNRTYVLHVFKKIIRKK